MDTRVTPPPRPPSSLAGIAARVVVVLALLGVALLAVRLADVAVLVFGGVQVAVVLRSASRPLARHSGMGERWALLIVVLALLLAIGLASVLLGGPVAEQAQALRQALPAALDEARRWLDSSPFGVALLQLWEAARSSAGDSLPWSSLARWASGLVGALGSIALVVFIGLYLALDPRLYRRGLLRLLPPAQREPVGAALDESGRALGRWMLGQAVSMVAVGTMTALGLALLGMPLALTLGVIAGLLTFVPYFGTIAAGLLIVLLAFTQGAAQALQVALLVFAVQQVDGYLVEPMAQRWAVSLPPVLGMVAVLVFGLLFGLLGAVLAVPLMVVVRVLVLRLYVERVLERPAGAVARAAPPWAP